MSSGKRGDSHRKKGISHYNFIVSFVLLVISLIFGKASFKKLVSQKLKVNDPKVTLSIEHLFVFFTVLFFLGFIFLEHGLAGSEFFETSTTDWTGEFWQTQSDGENITLLNQSAGNTNFSIEGNYTSNVLDAEGSARWENISWSEINQTALDNISMEYRTSNDNSSWSSWIEIANEYGLLNDSARYFQYRATLATNDSDITPYLQYVNVTYNKFPLIDYAESNPANNSYIIGNSTYLNFTVDDGDEDTFTINLNGTEYYFYNQTHEYNFSELDDGNYSYYAWVNDTLNQINTTDTREFVIDTTQPGEFNITSPENNSQVEDNSPVLYWQESIEENLANYTIEFSNQSDFGYVNSTYYSSSNSFSNYDGLLDNVTWYLRVTANDLAGNSRASDISEFTVAVGVIIRETVTVTTTTTSSTGSTRKPYALNIIAPPTITLYSNDEITIPLVIRNSAKDLQLQNINLAVTSDSGEILGFLDITNIARLLPGKEAVINLRLITGALKLLSGEGNFGLRITANVANPKYTDSIEIFANVIDVDSENRSAVYESLSAAHKLFDGNPGCKDLEELLVQADSALENNQIDKAMSLAKGAISACKDLVGLEIKDTNVIRLPFGIYLPFDLKDPFAILNKIPKNVQILSLEIVGLGIVLIALLKYVRSRRRIKGIKGQNSLLFLLFLMAFPSGGHKRSFDEIRIKLLKTLAENKKQTMNELAVNSGLCWKTVKTHIIYLKGKGFAKEVLSTPYVRIFEVTEKGEEESKII